jgi:hypothetical protein
MQFDAKSIAFGFLLAVLLMLVWRFVAGRTSFYTDLPDFPDNLSVEGAKALYDTTFKTLSDELDAKVKQAKELKNPDDELKIWKDGRNKLNEFSNKYDEYLLKKQKAQPDQAILHPNEPAPGATPTPAVMEAQAPAPEVMMQAPAPAPEMASPMAPAVSMYEPEPYY